MLAVAHQYRGQGIATKLVRKAVDAMIAHNADEVCHLACSISIGHHQTIDIE